MRKIFITIVVYVVLLGVLYLAFAFGNWSLNAGKWDVYVRSLCALFSLVVLGPATLIANYIDEEVL